MIIERTPLDTIIRDRIRATGPLPYAEVVDAALYDPSHGFYATTGRAGRRRGDFITSVEVGPLFGRLVARALDRTWDDLGQPDHMVMIDVGAGPGTLARAVLAAEPRCKAALDYVAVERSVAQRSAHPDAVRSVGEIPEGVEAGFVFANEVLDNMPFTPMEPHDDGAREIAVGVDGDDLVELAGGQVSQPTWAPDRRWHDQSAAGQLVSQMLRSVGAGRVVVVDYMRQRSEDVEVRTYRDHNRGGPVLEALGSQDITIDVDLTQLLAAAGDASALTDQASWLRGLGVDQLVAEGERIWAERAAIGDLKAIAGRSRALEAAALLDPESLGGFDVVEWAI